MNVFSKIIEGKTGLVYLDLRHNMITTEGAVALLESLKKNKNIQDLLLAGNNIDFKVISEIKTILAGHR